MKYTIGFKNLPFTPERRQVIYVENLYDQAINDAIVNNIDIISGCFHSHGFDFIYIPFLGSDKDLEARVRYYAPYLTSDITYEQLPQSSLLLNCLARPENRDRISPSLIVYGYKAAKKEVVFHSWSIDYNNDIQPLRAILDLVETINEYDETVGLTTNPRDLLKEIAVEEGAIDLESGIDLPNDRGFGESVRFSCREDVECCHPTHSGTGISSRRKKNQSLEMGPTMGFMVQRETAEPYEESESLESLLADLNKTVRGLQLKGLSLAALHELIDKHEKLSRVTITADYRIFLPDYSNIEIEMGPQPKALFFLFLRYPKGLVLKNLPDHYTELYNIYKQLRPKSEDERLRVTITKLVNPYGNAINENIARIRAAFVKNFDERLAQNYFVTGNKGEAYSIRLDRQLIDWLED